MKAGDPSNSAKSLGSAAAIKQAGWALDRKD